MDYPLYEIDMELDESRMRFIMENYLAKFNTLEDFAEFYEKYANIEPFKASENFHERRVNYSTRADLPDNESEFIKDQPLDPRVHWIMRMNTQYFLTKAFEAMKIDLTDPNVAVNALGKGTPGRIAKMWCGNDPEDTTELGSGRWNKEPMISCFPNEEGENADIITKEIDVVSCCSHHFLPFSTFDGGKAVISYKPRDYVLGISKLQRFCNLGVSAILVTRRSYYLHR